jgi:NAD(P)-dependent dehydrogenase (short-subunit alcohol dehydrogenase family)
MNSDLAGKNFIVTGANSGIGLVTARELARGGAHVIMACRSLEHSQPVADAIKRETGNESVEVVQLDLGSLASVRESASALAARDIPIHCLINNAGITAGLRGQKTLTPDGFEPTFGTNHLGHYLFTRMLLDRIKHAGSARIVNVSSHSHYQARKLDWDKLRQPPGALGLAEYAVSKLCNVLFTKELARRLAGTGVTAYALHPGQVATQIWDRRLPKPAAWLFKKMLFMITPEQGAVSMLHCATSPEVAGESGLYYDEHGRPKHPSRVAQNEALARELWVKSAEWTGLPVD